MPTIDDNKMARILRCLDDGRPHTTRVLSIVLNLNVEEVEHYLHLAQTEELVTWDRGDMWELTAEGKAAIMFAVEE